jgi:hypothetical protein
MSARGTTEEISRLVGHSSTRTTAVVHRHGLRPVVRTRSEVMDDIFSPKAGYRNRLTPASSVLRLMAMLVGQERAKLTSEGREDDAAAGGGLAPDRL